MSGKKVLVILIIIIALVYSINYLSIKEKELKLETEKVLLRKEQLKFLNTLMKLNGDLKINDKIKLSDSIIIEEKKNLNSIKINNGI